MLLAATLTTATACAGTANDDKGDGKKTAAAPAERVKPLAAAELKSALLSEGQAPDFRPSDSGGSRTGADKRASVETTEPATCLRLEHITGENSPGRGESAAAWQVLYPAEVPEVDVNNFPRMVLLTSYPVGTARTRMNELRGAVAACGSYGRVNPYGSAQVTAESLKVPDLGEEAVRFLLSDRTKSDSGTRGHAYSLVTVVRTGGAIASVRTSVALPLMTPTQAAKYKPRSTPDEAMIARLVKNVAEAERSATAR